MQVSDQRETPSAAFTLSPESRASLCCANLPGDWALYAVSVRRLIASESSLTCAQASFRPRLAATPLPSANTCANNFNNLLTGLTYRGLSPHKFTPMPGVHNALHLTFSAACAAPKAGDLECYTTY